MLSHIYVATIVGPRSIVELTLEPDPWIDSKLVLVEARDFALEMRGTSARCDLIGAEILHVVLKHEKAEGAAISVANVEASGVPEQVLVDVELLSAWSQVVIGRRSWHSWLDLDSERPVARTTSVKVTVLKVVLLTANQGDPHGESLADLLVDAIVNVVLLVEVAEVRMAVTHKKLLNRRWIRWVSQSHPEATRVVAGHVELILTVRGCLVEALNHAPTRCAWILWSDLSTRE